MRLLLLQTFRIDKIPGRQRPSRLHRGDIVHTMPGTHDVVVLGGGIKYGFGGIARVGYGMLPAEYIIAEHYHLGSSAAILSRGFCDANIVKDPREIESIFIDGVKNIRRKEKEVEKYSEEEYQLNLSLIREKVALIVEAKRKNR